MDLYFEEKNNELILVYQPERETIESLIDYLNKGNTLFLRRCFNLTASTIRGVDIDANEMRFAIGFVSGDYYELDKEVFGIDHQFFFHKSISIKNTFFIASRNISIIKKIDRIIEKDFYIDDMANTVEEGHIPVNAFRDLIAHFPKSSELDKYANSRISTILQEWFPETVKHQDALNKYLERQKSRHFYSNEIAKPVNQVEYSADIEPVVPM